MPVYRVIQKQIEQQAGRSNFWNVITQDASIGAENIQDYNGSDDFGISRNELKTLLMVLDADLNKDGKFEFDSTYVVKDSSGLTGNDKR